MSPTRLLRRHPWTSALVACALLAPAVFALTPAPGAVPATTAASASAASPTRPPLWKVSDKDNTLYLLGSFHLLKTSDYPLSQDVEAAFADAESLVFEVAPEDLVDPANMAKMFAAANFSDGQRLSTVLPPAVRDKLVAHVGQAQAAQLETFEPWFVNLQMVLAVAAQKGYQADQGLDSHLMQRAATAGKPTRGLESMDIQIQTLDAAPMDEQVAGLQDMIENPDEMPRVLDQMHMAWRTGDEGTLSRLMLQEMRAKTPVSYQQVNVARNDAWLPKLRAMLDNGAKGDDRLVVVGALHLLGDDGLVRKLRASGYKVERICTGCSGKR